MFATLFAESGFSLDRLRALLEVGAAGSIVKAAAGDPVRQSQYSRQIKELEDFFRCKLVERQGRGTRLTAAGRELARISRFFFLGLSNFRRGHMAEQQTFRVGAGATFTATFLLNLVSQPGRGAPKHRFVFESAAVQTIERRLHDLSLDFGIVGTASLSRPLKVLPLFTWRLKLCVPKRLGLSKAAAVQAFKQQTLPLVVAGNEWEDYTLPRQSTSKPVLVCDSFLNAAALLQSERFATLLPDFLVSSLGSRRFLRIVPTAPDVIYRFYLAWNPRLLRLNPVAARTRDWLVQGLSRSPGAYATAQVNPASH